MKPNDITTDGKPVYVLSIKQLPGCMAQGFTLGEAIRNLKEVIDEFTLILVEDGLVDPTKLTIAQRKPLLNELAGMVSQEGK